MEKVLHMTDFFSTSTACGACDKYQVWVNQGGLECLLEGGGEGGGEGEGVGGEVLKE